MAGALSRIGVVVNPATDSAAKNGPTHLWQRDWFLGTTLVVAIFAAYLAVGRAGFVWDDGLYITSDPLLSAHDGLRRIWFSLQSSPCQYFPMVYTVFRAEYALWGLHPAGYHWVNVFIHAINSILLWQLLRRLNVPGAWLAAALFGLHPVQVESVAWVSELKNVMSLFFCLLSLHAWISYLDERKGWFRRWDWLALACYLLALFSKTTACTLPAALLLICWLKRKKINAHRLLEMIPFVLAGIAMGLISIWWETTLGGTTGTAFTLSWPTRLLIASRAAWFYLGKLLWPAHLLTVYPHWHIEPANPLAYGWLLAAIIAAVIIYVLRRRNVTSAALFYVATLFPLLGFFMLYTFRYTFVADHWQYVASIGPLTLVASGLTILFRKFPASARAALCIPLLMGLAILTAEQTQIYASSETLWSDTLAGNPNCSIAHLNLGLVLAQRGDVAPAAEHYRSALEIDPDYAEAHENLGVLELNAGKADDAIKNFWEALGARPDFADAYSDLGAAWMQKGQPALATHLLKLSLEIAPDSAAAHFNLANILKQQGRNEDAIAHYRRAVEINPENADAWNNLGGIFLGAGRFDDAAPCLQKVAELRPNTAEAHSNLGSLLSRQGRDAAALAEFTRAAELGPNLFQVWNNLAWVLATSREASLRNGPKAVEFASRADLLSDGVNVTVLNTLAVAYVQAGDYSKAAAASVRGEKAAAAQGNLELAAQFHKQAELYASGQAAK